ncbi:MAG: tRNA lysidine(34) synthetase TilS [Aeromicrobium sp.]|uniref:tRNA lysidine(34) synthetase TilS n=1 Tax=Aeromicrobium sp. TaxID=1871063 RepID=UPI002625F9A2|nr:tRNA lysidine(34) synthetase TilS [Aeromicrobium sp.]MDF1704348.1 tRNA lysidine(34) synthetase TilS [Aeromicrobium sp.]
MGGGRLDPAVAAGRAAVRDGLSDVEPGSAVVVGVSGGADSLALAASLAFVAGRAAWDVTAVVVDHGLQPGSADVAARAAEQCRDLGLAAEVVTVEVGQEGGPEAAARAARHAALREHAAQLGAAALCLAHTLDDQAETVLLGLGRGSGARSLAAMTPRSGLVRRPFLGLRRSATASICAALGLDPWHDPHNADPRFRRVRVRHEVLPLLEDVLAGGVAEALARTAEQLARDAELLESLASGWLDAHPDPTVADLAVQHPAVRTRALHRLALAAGASAGELTAAHVLRLDSLVTDPRGGRTIELPGGIACTREADRLHFLPTQPAS